MANSHSAHLYNNFIKFNVPSRLTGQGCKTSTPLRTARSQLQYVIRDILYNNFIKFNVHRKLQG